MQFIETSFKDLIEIIPDVFHDERGYFFESYHGKKLADGNINERFIQDNQSFSPKGVLRGLHFQNPPYEQAKIVKVVTGSVLDVVVDLRKHSKSFGLHYKCILDGKENKMLYIPTGFAHGFLALEDTHFYYKCSQFYHKEAELGIAWNDISLNIDWGIQDPIISEKDQSLPSFAQIKDSL